MMLHKITCLTTFLLAMTSFIENFVVDGLKCQSIIESNSLFMPTNEFPDISRECSRPEDKCLRANVVTDSHGILNISMTIGYCTDVDCNAISCSQLHQITISTLKDYVFEEHKFLNCKIACCTSDYCNKRSLEDILDSDKNGVAGYGPKDLLLNITCFWVYKFLTFLAV